MREFYEFALSIPPPISALHLIITLVSFLHPLVAFLCFFLTPTLLSSTSLFGLYSFSIKRLSKPKEFIRAVRYLRLQPFIFAFLAVFQIIDQRIILFFSDISAFKRIVEMCPTIFFSIKEVASIERLT